MTLTDKQKVADFLDITKDYLGSGYKSEKIEYQFTDDSQVLTESGGKQNKILNTDSIDSFDSSDSIEKIAEEIKLCKKCKLCEKRLNAAPGEGVLNPLVLVIGEGPGEDEDKQGRPFVGKAGQLLDKMLAAIDLSRKTNCFIANVVKCRPPNNRDPHPDETSACANFLQRQIFLLKPKYILAAGRVAAQTLLKTTESIGRLRGTFAEIHAFGVSFPLLVTYHPAAILRNDDLKRPAWEDLKLLKSKLGI